MAHSITLINKGTDYFDTWVNKTNEIANVITQEALTANTNANGAYITGNSYLFGIFGANTLAVWNTIRGGNVQSSAPLYVGSNLIINTAGADFSRVGNSTVYTTANSTAVYAANGLITAKLAYTGLTVGNVFANQSHLYVGSGSVNVISNTSTILLGGNVGANQTHLFVGVSAGNVVINTSTVSLGGNVLATQTTLQIGATAANVTLNSSAVAVGSNAALGYGTLQLGNSTVNAFSNSTLLTIRNATSIANHSALGFAIGTSVVNSTYLAAGANVLANTTSIYISEAASNTFANASLVKVQSATATANHTPSGFYIGTTSVASGNVTVGANVIANLTHLAVLGTGSNVLVDAITVSLGGNVTANQTMLRVGASTVNVQINSSTISLGGNVTANQTMLRVGDGAVNVQINSSAISISGTPLISETTRDQVKVGAGSLQTAKYVHFKAGDNIFLTQDYEAGNNAVVLTINAVAESGSGIIGGYGIPGAIQFNDGNNFDGVGEFVYNKADRTVTLSNTMIVQGQMVHAYSIQQKGIEVSDTSSTGPDDIDIFAIASYRTAEYVYSIKNNEANNYQAGKLIVLQDGGGTHVEEFGVAVTNSSAGLMGSFSAVMAANMTHVQVQFTPTASLTYTCRLFRTAIP